MRLVTYSTELSGPSFGLLLDDRIYDVYGLGGMLGLFLQDDMLRFLDLGDAGMDALDSLMKYLGASDAPSWSSDQARIWAPVPRPGKVLAVAGNYQAHLMEGGGSGVDKQRSTPRFHCPHTLRARTTATSGTRSGALPIVTEKLTRPRRPTATNSTRR